MNVVVHAPGQYLGDLTRDVSRRRGEILNTSLDKGRCMLHAYVPLAELFGYTSELRNFTSGTASLHAWSRATTPRSRKSWRICGRRAKRDQFGEPGA